MTNSMLQIKTGPTRDHFKGPIGDQLQQKTSSKGPTRDQLTRDQLRGTDKKPVQFRGTVKRPVQRDRQETSSGDGQETSSEGPTRDQFRGTD